MPKRLVQTFILHNLQTFLYNIVFITTLCYTTILFITGQIKNQIIG